VPAAAAIVEPYLDLSTIPLAFFSTPETKAVNAQQDAARRSRMSARGDGVTDRLRDLDEMGIDLQDAAAAAMLLHGANRHQRKSDANRK
jgi:hypothetical protein